MNKQAGLGIQNWDFQQTDNGDVTNNQENQWNGKGRKFNQNHQ